MKRLLFLLLFLPVFAIGQNQVPPSTKSVGDYDQTIRARDTLFTDYHFVYRDTVIPVLDISYHEFSADSINWHKPWVTGDIYIRISNDVKNTWKVLNIIDLIDPLWARDGDNIYNLNDGTVNVVNSLHVSDSIDTDNFYFLNGDSLRITWLNATDGSTGDILQNIGGVAYWIPLTSVFDSAGFYDVQNINSEGIGVWNNTNENIFYFRGVDVDSSFLAIDLNDENHTIVIAFDPTNLSVTAGIGLSGGGAFDASGNVIVNLSIPELTTSASYDSTDWFAMYDVSLGSHRKVHISSITGGTSTDSVFWIAANDGDIDTVFNYSPIFFEEGDSIIGIEVSGDSVIFTVNGCLVPPGGQAGYVLVKLSDADCDLGWVNFCDLVEVCDTPDVILASMCSYAAPYFADVTEVTGYLSVGELTSDIATIGEYVIDWYLNDVIQFTSSSSGAGVSDVIIHPFSGVDMIPVPGGMYEPQIRWVEINGSRYAPTEGHGGIVSADLWDCLSQIYAEPFNCSNGNITGIYSHQVSYDYIRASSLETPDRELSFDLDATTSYVPWHFTAAEVVDTLRVYLVQGASETLIETWQVGLLNYVDNYAAHNIYSSYLNKITDLTDYTISEGDYIKFRITPTALTTDWDLKWKCLDALDYADKCEPFLKSYQTIDSTSAMVMTYDESQCRYELDFSTQTPHVNNDFTRYIYETYDWPNGQITYASHYSNDFELYLNKGVVTCSFLWSPNSSYGCTALDAQMTYEKDGDTVRFIASDVDDYTRMKNQLSIILANSAISNYSPDPEDIAHYKMIRFSGSSYPTCPSDEPTPLTTMYTAYDKTNVIYDDANYTIKIGLIKAVDGMTDTLCNNCGTSAASWDVPYTTDFYNLPDFSHTFSFASWNIAGGRWTRSAASDQTDVTASVQVRGRYASYGGALHEEIVDLCDNYDNMQLISNRHYFYPAYVRVVITGDASDPVDAVQNYDVYNVLDENGHRITDSGSYRLVYRMVDGVGTWYETGL